MQEASADVVFKNHAFSTGNHYSMVSDTVRTKAYADAIGRQARGRRVLDVGSGPYCLLGRQAHCAGATFVACVEQSPKSIRLALEILKREFNAESWGLAPRPTDSAFDEECAQHIAAIRSIGLRLRVHTLQCPQPRPDGGLPAALVTATPLRLHPQPAPPPPLHDATDSGAGDSTLALYFGLSSNVPLPGRMDLVVHEILGHIASAEGVLRALSELRARPGLLLPHCSFVPRAAGTMIAPTSRLDAAEEEALLRRTSLGARCALDSPPALLHVHGFPAGRVLAPPQQMEWYRFEMGSGLKLKHAHTLHFVTEAEGWLDGLHLHLFAELDEETSIDAAAQDTTWECIYIRLLRGRDAVWLQRGERVDLAVEIDCSTDVPQYAVELMVGAPPAPPTTSGSPAQSRNGRLGGDRVVERRRIARFSWAGDGEVAAGRPVDVRRAPPPMAMHDRRVPQ